MLATIYEIMTFNKISLEDLIEFIDTKQETFKSSQYTYGKDKKWGDEAIELDELEELSKFVANPVTSQKLGSKKSKAKKNKAKKNKAKTTVEETVEQVDDEPEQFNLPESSDKPSSLESSTCEETNTSPWMSAVKKPAIMQPTVIKTAFKQQQDAKQPTKEVEEEDKRFVIYTVQEFIQCIKEKQKLHVDYTIDPDSHCEHTFNGTVCRDVKGCGKIHVQRCINNLNCQYKFCQFLHADEMPDQEAMDNYMDTMSEYNRIKKSKQVYV